MNDSDVFDRILKRLDVLVCLQLERTTDSSSVALAAQIKRLRNLGLAPAEIAAVLGKPTNQVTAALAKLKQGRKSKGK